MNLDQFMIARLVRYARVMVGADAADAVQDALISCWHAERRGREIVEPYLFRAVRSRCIDILRRRRCRPETPVGEWRPEPGVPDVLPAVYDLAALTPKQRDLVERVMAGEPVRARRHQLAHIRMKLRRIGLTEDVLKGVA